MTHAKNNLIKGNTGDWEIVIGLEVHAQINTNSKLFSGAATHFGCEPNANVAFVDAGMPGMLPVLNKSAVELAVKTGLAINAEINLHSVFDRKNYFYPDLPQGYQISQFLDPIVGKGEILLDMPEGVKKVGVTRIHIEQDAGKSLHEYKPKNTCIDLNRAGVPLMEIVSEPDMRCADEAVAYVKKLRAIVRYIGTCDGDMEKGNLRCDANVSVRKLGAELGTRCEIKNVNSMRFLHKAIEFEAMRQVEILESGGVINQETRLFDSVKSETRTMRTKEDAHDYRYFPDPDLLPLEFSQEFVDSLRATLPELPDQKKERYIKDFGLSLYDASVLIAEKATTEYFEELVKKAEPKLAANWMTSELFARLNKLGLDIENSPITAANFAGLLALISDNTISGKIAKDVLDFMFEDSSKTASQIVAEKGLKQVTDTGAIEKIIDEVLAANPDKVAEYKGGKDKLFAFFVGQVMKASSGKANPVMLSDLLKAKLE